MTIAQVNARSTSTGQRSFQVVVGARAVGGIEEWRKESSVHVILYEDAPSAGGDGGGRESSEMRQMAKVHLPPAAKTPS